MGWLVVAALTLAVIVFASLKVEDLKKKVGIYLGVGAFTVLLLGASGEDGRHVLKDVFVVDYPQFIFVPLVTVLIASLGLFSIRVDENAKIGWFLWLVCPLIGNFATTWALVPIVLSLFPILRRKFPEHWLMISIMVCVFSMNFMALGTLAADPPQAYWAIKSAMMGKPLAFFMPFKKFWPYLLTTMVVYLVTLKRLGVTFGHIKELKAIHPEHKGKALYGVAIAACIGTAITFLGGYAVTGFLGAIFALGCAFSMSRWFGHTERHRTFEWCVETSAVFIAFFGVVAFAHAGLHHIKMSNQGMIIPVVVMTLGADNAAAFAAGFPQYEKMSEDIIAWFNLFNSVVYGGVSPLGNGPQIALFLVILVGLKVVTPGQVFKTWLKEAAIFFPYLLTWTLATSCLLELQVPLTPYILLLIGLGASVVCFQFMDLQAEFRRTVDEPVEPSAPPAPQPAEVAHTDHRTEVSQPPPEQPPAAPNEPARMTPIPLPVVASNGNGSEVVTPIH